MVYGFEIRLRTGRDYGANVKSTTLVVIATSLLNASQGMTRCGYGIAAMIGYSLCFWLMAFAMTRIPRRRDRREGLNL